MKQYTTEKTGEMQGSVSVPDIKLDYIENDWLQDLLNSLMSALEDAIRDLINDQLSNVIEEYYGDIYNNIINYINYYINRPVPPTPPIVPPAPPYEAGRGISPSKLRDNVIEWKWNEAKGLRASEAGGAYIKIDVDGDTGLSFEQAEGENQNLLQVKANTDKAIVFWGTDGVSVNMANSFTTEESGTGCGLEYGTGTGGKGLQVAPADFLRTESWKDE